LEGAVENFNNRGIAFEAIYTADEFMAD
jgi:hypothetical protein